MTPDAYRATLADEAAPAQLSAPLAALWWAAKDRWDVAHGLVQEASGADAAWVHAYLHRVEGDPDNARYWYARAGRAPEAGDPGTEWRMIAETLLAES